MSLLFFYQNEKIYPKLYFLLCSKGNISDILYAELNFWREYRGTWWRKGD